MVGFPGAPAIEWPAPQLPITEIQLWAVEAQERGIQTPRRREVMPLTLFPDDHLERIRYEVEQDWKPRYWLDFGVCQIPSRAWVEWYWQRGLDPDARRPAIPTWMRNRVLARDGYVCQICLLPVDPTDVHLDHIKPWSRGGIHSVTNLRVTHSLCNMRKAARY